MNDPVYDELVRLSSRREPTVDDRLRIEALLVAHPGLRARWEEDAAVSNALRGLADAPVSSNFTARVMEAIDLEERAAQRRAQPGGWRRWIGGWRPRVGWGVALTTLMVLGVFERQSAQRARMARDVVTVSHELAALPDPKVLQDFDAINQLRHVSAVSDDELLRVLQ